MKGPFCDLSMLFSWHSPVCNTSLLPNFQSVLMLRLWVWHVTMLAVPNVGIWFVQIWRLFPFRSKYICKKYFPHRLDVPKSFWYIFFSEKCRSRNGPLINQCLFKFQVILYSVSKQKQYIYIYNSIYYIRCLRLKFYFFTWFFNNFIQFFSY